MTTPRALFRKLILAFVTVAPLSSCGGSIAPDDSLTTVASAVSDDRVIVDSRCGVRLLDIRTGDIPILLTAPHAGEDRKPNGVSQRTCEACEVCEERSVSALRVGDQVRACAQCGRCKTGRDVDTAPLTNAIEDEIYRQTGGRPFVVRALFDRKFLDANRQDTWASYEDPDAANCYAAYHDAVRGFVETIQRDFRGEGLMVDIHGISIKTCEGGLRDGLTCAPGDADSDARTCPASAACTGGSRGTVICTGTRNGRTIAALEARHGHEAISGANGLMGAIEAAVEAADSDWSVYPSYGPGPVHWALEREDNCLNGGHSVVTYGSNNTDGIDAIQLEFDKRVRTNRTLRDKVGQAVGAGLARFYEHYLSPQITLADFGMNDAVGDQLGAALTTGDFDGDGLEDLAVGVPGWDDGVTNAGAVAVRYGEGARREVLRQQHTRALSARNDAFGSTLAVGDFDGDGYDDLVVGVPAKDAEAVDDGLVFVFYGSPEGLLVVRDQSVRAHRLERLSLSHAYGQAEADDRFGAALAVGDFDRDGLDDLAVGVPGDTRDAAHDGRVVVFFGNVDGLTELRGDRRRAGTFERIDQSHVDASGEADDGFGAALSAGDYDGDGFADLAVGVPGEDHDGEVDNGMVVVLYGSTAGLLDGGVSTLGAVRYERVVQGHTGAREDSGDGFGAVLASGDLDGDGRDDLVVGMPDEDVEAIDDGLVIVLYAGPGGFLTGPTVATYAQAYARFSQTLVGDVNEAGDRFGQALAIGDVNGDGANDLVIGAPFEGSTERPWAGQVAVIYGQPGGPSLTSLSLRLGQSPYGVGEVGDTFGTALCIGDTDGDGRGELFVGAPGEDVLGAADVGTVYPMSYRPLRSL